MNVALFLFKILSSETEQGCIVRWFTVPITIIERKPSWRNNSNHRFIHLVCFIYFIFLFLFIHSLNLLIFIHMVTPIVMQSHLYQDVRCWSYRTVLTLTSDALWVEITGWVNMRKRNVCINLSCLSKQSLWWFIFRICMRWLAINKPMLLSFY